MTSVDHRNDVPSTAQTHVPALIDGQPYDNGAWNAVCSPYDARMLGYVPECSEADIDRAVAVAGDRLSTGPIPLHERAAILDRVALALSQRQEDFARSISDEAAKPITAARTEVSRAIDTIRFSAAAARDLCGEMIAMDASTGGSSRLGFTLRVPIGVVACITPFNFPLNLVCHKIAPGVAAGVPLILKPASATPLTALMIARLFEECGLPGGWLNVVTCPGRTASHLVTHPDVSMITFTGSAEVGWSIRGSVPKKRVSLELGNSSPVIVAADADIDLAARSIVHGGFGYSGQTCISVQRVYAHKDIHDDLLDRVRALTADLAVGDPSNEATVVSSLIDHHSAIRLRSHITEAIAQGARVVHGDPSPSLNTDSAPLNLLMPTILDDITVDMAISADEAFGPVIGFARFSELNDAFELANGTRYGLQAGVFTSSIEIALQASRALEFGGVIVNDSSSYRTDQQPYGGVKESGNTREGPKYAIDEMTESRTVIIR